MLYVRMAGHVEHYKIQYVCECDLEFTGDSCETGTLSSKILCANKLCKNILFFIWLCKLLVVSVLKRSIQLILYFCRNVRLGLCFDTNVSLPSNGDRSCTNDGFDMSCVVSCDSGYHLDESTDRNIKFNCSNGVWDSQNIQRSCMCSMCNMSFFLE